jgi:branched-chain amino acid transport system permease protein
LSEFLQSLLRGLGTGGVYTLLALGFVIIYKSTRVISFAQPAFMLTGAVLVTYLHGPLGFYFAVPVAAALTALLALGIERAAVRPMIGRPVFTVAIITLGIDIAVRVVVNGFIGLDVRQVGDPWGLTTWQLPGGVVVEWRYVAMFATTMVLVAALFAFYRYTRTGLAMRAAAYDQEAALAQGVSVGMVFALSWALAGALAAVAGVFVGTGAGVDQQLWLLALKALPVIILGGLDSLPGAVVGGLVVGVVESLVGTYQGHVDWLGGNASIVSPYVLMLLVLLLRPYGMFGTREVERV